MAELFLRWRRSVLCAVCHRLCTPICRPATWHSSVLLTCLTASGSTNRTASGPTCGPLKGRLAQHAPAQRVASVWCVWASIRCICNPAGSSLDNLPACCLHPLLFVAPRPFAARLSPFLHSATCDTSSSAAAPTACSASSAMRRQGGGAASETCAPLGCIGIRRSTNRAAAGQGMQEGQV